MIFFYLFIIISSCTKTSRLKETKLKANMKKYIIYLLFAKNSEVKRLDFNISPFSRGVELFKRGSCFFSFILGARESWSLDILNISKHRFMLLHLSMITKLFLFSALFGFQINICCLQNISQLMANQAYARISNHNSTSKL